MQISTINGNIVTVKYMREYPIAVANAPPSKAPIPKPPSSEIRNVEVATFLRSGGTEATDIVCSPPISVPIPRPPNNPPVQNPKMLVEKEIIDSDIITEIVARINGMKNPLLSIIRPIIGRLMIVTKE